MNSNLSPSEVFRLIDRYSSADCYARPASEVHAGAKRLECGFYGSDGYRAVRNMKKSGFQLGTVEQFAKVRWFGPFARTYVADRTAGVAFLSSADMMCAKLEPKNYLSKALTRNLERLLISEGTILISCSGTIGNVVICSSDYNDMAVSQHAIRVNALDDVDMGLLYVFLQSEPGQFLLTRNKSGSVIESIYESDVSSLTIPILPKALRSEFTNLIKKANSLRVKANALLIEAERECQVTCELDELPEDQGIFFARLKSDAMAFSVSSSTVGHEPEYAGSLRLDASSFNPEAREIRHRVTKVKHDQLKNLVDEVIYIGKVYRNFVEDEKTGIPLLSGKDLVVIRPKKDKMLSILDAKHIDRCKVKRGWILVSRSGNIGRVSICHRNYEDWVASEHILRIIPRVGSIDPYYLTLFLSSNYGQVQLNSYIYGSVILTLSKDQMKTVLVPIPKDNGQSIGRKVRSAYDCRADANDCEDKAIELFMSAIREGKEVVESKWGKDY